MAKLSKKEVEDIIKKDLPGYQVVSEAPAADAPTVSSNADESSPDIAELRKQYQEKDSPQADGADAGATHPADNPSNGARVTEAGVDADGGEGGNPGSDYKDHDEPEDQIVVVAPKDATDPFDPSSRAKTVVISGKDRKVIGTQG